jgi:hypothetical protein
VNLNLKGISPVCYLKRHGKKRQVVIYILIVA